MMKPSSSSSVRVDMPPDDAETELLTVANNDTTNAVDARVTGDPNSAPSVNRARDRRKTATTSRKAKDDNDSSVSPSTRRRLAHRKLTWSQVVYHDGMVFKRTPLAWLKSVLYIIALFICFSVYSVAQFYMVIAVSNPWPRLFGPTSFIGGTPKLIYEPNVFRGRTFKDAHSPGEIKYDPNKPESYDRHVQVMRQTFKSVYSIPQPCKTSSLPTDDSVASGENVCPTNVYSNDEVFGLGACYFDPNSTTNFGFDTSQPCFYLRLTKLLGWIPTNFTSIPSTPALEAMCGGQAYCCHRKRLTIKCNIDVDDKGADKMTNSTVTVFPSAGISACGYPYWQQPNYQSPLAAVKLDIRDERQYVVVCRVDSLPPYLPNHRPGDEHKETGMTAAIFRVKLEVDADKFKFPPPFFATAASDETGTTLRQHYKQRPTPITRSTKNGQPQNSSSWPVLSDQQSSSPLSSESVISPDQRSSFLPSSEPVVSSESLPTNKHTA